jgi:alpha-ribazole phosphatase
MTRILLVRHGVTNWNQAERLQGRSDLALNAAGLQQAAAAAARLAAEPLEAIYTSNLKRARQTARIIATPHGLAVTSFTELDEIHFGEWEGLTYAAIQARDPLATQAWSKDLLNFTPPGGESLARMASRVAGMLPQLISLPQDTCLAIVAHGGPLQVLICLAVGLPAERYWQFRLSPGSISQIDLYPEGAILTTLNDTNHLNNLGSNQVIPNTQSTSFAYSHNLPKS